MGDYRVTILESVRYADKKINWGLGWESERLKR